MTRKREKTNYDRFLQQRAGNFYYKRRVPIEVADLDDRAPHVRIALKTDDVAMARIKRDALELADNEYWASLLSGSEHALAQKQYTAAMKRAQAFGFSYKPAGDLARDESISEIVQQLSAQCNRCGHIADIDPQSVSADLANATDIYALRAKLKCSPCGSKDVELMISDRTNKHPI